MVTINEKKNLQTMRPESGFQISPNWRLIGKRIMISQAIYMTSSPSFFDVTTFLLSSVVIDPSILTNTLQNLAADWKERDLVFLFFAFFKHRLSVSLFPVFRKCSKFWTNFRNYENSFNYSVAKYFHHTNINHIAIMSFIKVKSLDNSFNAILF